MRSPLTDDLVTQRALQQAEEIGSLHRREIGHDRPEYGWCFDPLVTKRVGTATDLRPRGDLEASMAAGCPLSIDLRRAADQIVRWWSASGDPGDGRHRSPDARSGDGTGPYM